VRAARAASEPIEVLVASDDAAGREALADLIAAERDLRLVGFAADRESTVTMAAEHAPRIIVMDLRMLRDRASDAIRAIRARSPRTRVVALSFGENPGTVLEVVEAGANGYLGKGTPAGEILEAIRRAARSQFSMTSALAADFIQGARRRAQRPARAEQRLSRRVRETSLALLGQVPCAALAVRPRGRIEFANPAAHRLFGYGAGELRHRQLAELLPDPLRTVADQVARGAVSGPVEAAGRRQDGTEFPVLINTATLPGRHPLRAVYLTERAAARPGADRFQQFVETCPDAVVIVDAAGQIRQVNAQACELFGYECDQLTGESVEILLPDQPLTVSLRDHGPGAGPGGGTGHSLELVGRRGDGRQFPVDVSVSALSTGQGPLAVLVIRDITEIQRAQFVLERSVELLEAADRDRQPLLRHLVHAQEQERARIAAGIHDDTIQVITAMHLRLQQLRRRLREPADLQLADKLEEMLRMSLARLRQLIFDLRPPSTELGSLAAALREYLEHFRAETGIDFRLEDHLQGKLSAEATALMYRTAQEALTNVRKHAHARNVRVQLLTVDGGCLVRIVDDGVGYDPLEVETRPGHLGLTLMQERMEIAGGWCRIESAPGAGTTVEFWVPVNDLPSGATATGDAAGARARGGDSGW
jgi:PAS domain S-box-containing protein